MAPALFSRADIKGDNDHEPPPPPPPSATAVPAAADVDCRDQTISAPDPHIPTISHPSTPPPPNPTQSLLLRLPEELLQLIVQHLDQSDLGALACTAKSLNAVATPRLYRSFRCVSCTNVLFRPQHLTKCNWRLVDASPLYTNSLPRRSFLELDPRRLPRLPPHTHRPSNTQHHHHAHYRQYHDHHRLAGHPQPTLSPPPIPIAHSLLPISEPLPPPTPRPVPRSSEPTPSPPLTYPRDIVQPPVHPNSLLVDGGVAKANFMAMRHLRQINLVDGSEAVKIRVVRCGHCRLYVGFLYQSRLAADTLAHSHPALLRPHYPDSRLELDEEDEEHVQGEDGDATESGLYRQNNQLISFRRSDQHHLDLHDNKEWRTHGALPFPASDLKPIDCAVGFPEESRMFISRELVQLVDSEDLRVNLRGMPLDLPQDMHVYCDTLGCGQLLFDREDMMPWSHVLASSRLTDLDPFLEHEHAWGDGRPALFVRRLAADADVTVTSFRLTQLRQGVMKTRDLHCGWCKHLIGWQFIAESSNGPLRSYDQVGRFGILRDAVSPVEPLLM